MTYALDTNIASYFIQNDVHVIARFRAALISKSKIVIPPVTYYEILRGFKHKPAPEKEKAFQRMCKLFPIGEMTFPVWEQAAIIYASIRKMGIIIGDADILTAAFCIVNGYTLVTHNTKHFDKIDGLSLEDWAK